MFEEELKVQPHLKVSDVPERSSDSPTEGSQSSAEFSRIQPVWIFTVYAPLA